MILHNTAPLILLHTKTLWTISCSLPFWEQFSFPNMTPQKFNWCGPLSYEWVSLVLKNLNWVLTSIQLTAAETLSQTFLSSISVWPHFWKNGLNFLEQTSKFNWKTYQNNPTSICERRQMSEHFQQNSVCFPVKVISGNPQSVCLLLFPISILSVCALRFEKVIETRVLDILNKHPFRLQLRLLTIYYSVRDKCFIHLSGKCIFLPSPHPPQSGIMDLALHQEPGTHSLHLVPKTTACILCFWLLRLYLLVCFILRGEKKARWAEFVVGARGSGRCVFNYYLVKWWMEGQSSRKNPAQCVCLLIQLWPCLYVCKHLC